MLTVAVWPRGDGHVLVDRRVPMRAALTRCVPAGTSLIVNRPSAPVRAPSCVPTTVTETLAIGRARGAVGDQADDPAGLSGGAGGGGGRKKSGEEQRETGEESRREHAAFSFGMGRNCLLFFIRTKELEKREPKLAIALTTERPATRKSGKNTHLTTWPALRFVTSGTRRRPRPRYCSRNEHSRPPNLCIRGRSRQRQRVKMTLRWFGPTDPIPLAYIRQIPGVTGVVSAIYDTPVGDAWPRIRSRTSPSRSTRPACRSPSSKASPSTRTSSSDARRATGSSTPGARALPRRRDRRARRLLQLHARLRLDAQQPRDAPPGRFDGPRLRRRRARPVSTSRGDARSARLGCRL